jgi:hypothetical protein
METLAWHISDESNRDEPSNWKQVWNENEILQHSNI